MKITRSAVSNALIESPTVLGRLSVFPAEVRQEIYLQFILLCRRIPTNADSLTQAWPTPSLLTNEKYILVRPTIAGSYCHKRDEGDYGSYIAGTLTNLLCVNSSIHGEVETVFYTRCVFLFSTRWCIEESRAFTVLLNERAKAQIGRLSLLLHIGKAPSLVGLEKQRVLEWREGNKLLAKHLPRLRTVCFEIRVPENPVTPKLHRPMQEKCLVVARPFKDVSGLRISWVGENRGAHIAQLCESVTGSGEDWPRNRFEQRLYLMLEEDDS